jgi:hypothetical protein
MRTCTLCFVLICYLTCIVAEPASAKECMRTRMFSWDSAVNLAYVLKETAVTNERRGKTKVVIYTGSVQCSERMRADSLTVIPIYRCHGNEIAKPGQLSGSAYLTGPIWNPFASKLLWDALFSTGIETEADMGEVLNFSVRNVRCEINYGRKEIKDNPRCEITAAWKNCNF